MGESHYGFLVCLPRILRGNDSICIIVHRLTKSAHFLPIKTIYGGVTHADIYTIQVTSRFWRSFKEALGTQVDFSNAFHLHIDGQFEHTIKILEDILRACILDFGGSWDTYFSLA